jgi:hypothetical protein
MSCCVSARYVVAAVISLLFVANAFGGTEQLSLTSSLLYSQVIKGGEGEVDAYVRNTAPIGSDTANYSVTADYAGPGAGSFTNIGYSYNGSQPADGGASFSAKMPFAIDTSLFTPGTATVNVSATDTATNGVLTQQWQFTVLAHVTPEIYSQVQNKYVPIPAAQEPSVDPLAFGATSGGETFAATSGAVAGRDPPEPTAGMALNSIVSIGDSQITTNLAIFSELDAIAETDENPADGDQFSVQCDTTHVGIFTKTFWLSLSDEQDLPGADAPNSYVAAIRYTFNVAADGSSTYEVDLVPEPTTIWLLLAGIAPGYCMMRRVAGRC